MTTRTTTLHRDKGGMRELIGATALTLAVLSGGALWQVRDAGDTPATPTVAARGTVGDGVVPMGGMAERYAELERAAAAAREARVPTMGGMAELYTHRAAEAAAVAELEARLGGQAELYRYQAQRAGAAQ